MSVSTPTSPGPLDAVRGKVLVFIVSYEAEKHIRGVLDRVPAAVLNDPDVHVLVIDDASHDAGASLAANWAAERGVTNLTALRNPVNQGYGGNQKLGYRIALERGFDFVILLHGDGQYAPELLPQFIDAWRADTADVVLGSRMHSVKSARSGGMAWHKVIGNRVLTTLQNKLTGQKLGEYHTGYRGYSAAFLRAVPFEVNTNDFHFDTEILLQAFHVGAKIIEFAIPTHYGDEVCRVQGMRYARDVVIATLLYKAHRSGLLCSLRYQNLAPARYRDKTDALYTSHRLALNELLRARPATVLDLGCGPGFVARECEKSGMRVTGVDAFEPMPGMMSEFRRVDLENESPPVDAFSYDAVLLLDVIEHLARPEDFLLDLRNRSAATRGVRTPPTVIISTPNIAFAAIRLNLLLGRFTYAERGILDITHKRLFTKSTLLRTLGDCGYRVQKYVGVPAPFEAVMPGATGRLLGAIANAMARAWPAMFAFQSLVVCRPLPGVHQLVSQAQRQEAQAAA
ncbi:MAG TPA: bifunctional glycosyltransferase/class I SAM-dependent methyltransferase [Tepidisphaeraceae bacterium]|jgi:glycosyltransferase involved in cell wall biosynthesis